MLLFDRSAVLPQFMTWIIQVGTDAFRFRFRVQARYTATKFCWFPYSSSIDQKT